MSSEIGLDVLGNIISFCESSSIFHNLCLVSKSIRRFLTMDNYSYCSNIQFDIDIVSNAREPRRDPPLRCVHRLYVFQNKNFERKQTELVVEKLARIIEKCPNLREFHTCNQSILRPSIFNTIPFKTTLQYFGSAPKLSTRVRTRSLLQMKGLKRLEIPDCDALGDSFLRKLFISGIMLEYLNISGSKTISNGFSYFRETLLELRIHDCKMVSDVNLKELEILQVLDCSRTNVSETGLLHLVTLTHLDISEQRIFKASNLFKGYHKNIKYLKCCWMQNDFFENFDRLKSLENLTELDLSKNRYLVDFHAMSESIPKSVRVLNLSRCKSISDLSIIGLSNENGYRIRNLNISHNELLKGTGLGGMKDSLLKLTINGCILISLEEVKGLTGLEELRVGGRHLNVLKEGLLDCFPRLNVLDCPECFLMTFQNDLYQECIQRGISFQ